MTVSREEFERALQRIAAETKDPRAGIFGPESQVWRIGKHAVTFLGGGRAALLQTAHPFVAHAIDQHSTTKADPAGRFRRTFEHIFAMVFGDLDAALRSARRVFAIHERIAGAITEDVGRFERGTRYHANAEEALLWVHATLFDTALEVYELVIQPLSIDVKRAYYEETKRFAPLFGIPDAILPRSWEDFVAYNRAMWSSDVLAVGRPASELRRFLLEPPRPSMKPLADWYTLMTAGLLPAPIREQYGFAFGFRERAAFAASVRALRTAVRIMPPRLKYLPSYVEARRRMRGTGARDRVGRFVERAAIEALQRVPKRAAGPRDVDRPAR